MKASPPAAEATSRGLRGSDEARIAHVLATLPVALVTLDRDGRISYVNSAAEVLLGRSAEQLTGAVVLWEVLAPPAAKALRRHVAAVLRTSRPIAFETRLTDADASWVEVRIWPHPDGVSVCLVDAADRLAERRRAQRDATRAAVLADVSDQLVSTLDPAEGVARLAQILCRSLADWCVITLVGDDPTSLRGLRDLGWWHGDPELVPLVDRYAATRLEALGADSHLAAVLRTGEPAVIETGASDRILALLQPGPARDVLAELAPTAAVVLPLRGRGGIVGLLSAYLGPGRSLSPDDVATLREIADRAGLAVDNARLYAQQRDLAESLQRSLLTRPPHRPGLEIVVRYAPAAAAAQVGGDWYDVFVRRDGATALVIGDVVGHDTAAVAAMGELRGLLRGIALSGGDGPLGIVSKLDEVIVALGSEVTATAVVAQLAGNRLCWTNAGHPPPVLVPARGAVRTLARPTSDLLLGIDPGTTRHDQEIALGADDTLVLHTDGLVERRGQSLDEGTALLRATLERLRNRPLGELCDELIARMLPANPEDDVAVLAVRLAAGGGLRVGPVVAGAAGI